MKKKIFLLLLIVALGAMTVSCFKKKDDKKNQQTTEQKDNTTGTINTDMFNAGNQPTGDPNIKNLTPEEQQFLINNQIDPAKVSPAIDKAQQGDKEAILSLAQLYFNLKDNEKTKKYLQMGVDKNYPEAIYNLAVLLKQEGKEAEAKKLMDRESWILCKLALGRGFTAANFEIGAILYDTGKQSEARPYLMKAYNSGNKALAMPIALSYHKENNMKEALKWYKIAAKNGDKDAKAAVAEIEGGSNKVNSILGDNSKRSLTDSTISNLKNNEPKSNSIFNPSIGKNEQTSSPDYNVNLDKNSGNSKQTNTAASGKADNKSAKPSNEQTQQQKQDEKEQKRAEKAVADAIRRASKRKGSNKGTSNPNAVPSDKSIEDVINKKAAEYK